jgi:hypothetical protein
MAIPAQFIAGIINGEYDDDLERIRQAIRSREKEASRKRAEVNMLTLEPGVRVVMRGLSPKYLNGRTGTIVPASPGYGARAIAVKQDEFGYGGSRDREIVHVPPQCVERI